MDMRLVLVGMAVVAVLAFGSMRLYQITGSASSSGQTQEILVVIDSGSEVSEHRVLLGPRETAFDALKRVAVPDYRMQAPSAVIVEINGIRQDGEHRWVCEVNGKTPQDGCDRHYPVTGDVVKYSFVGAE